MSDVATAGMILALAVLALSYYFFLDKWIQNRVAAILTGVLEGVSISGTLDVDRRVSFPVGSFLKGLAKWFAGLFFLVLAYPCSFNP